MLSMNACSKRFHLIIYMKVYMECLLQYSLSTVIFLVSNKNLGMVSRYRFRVIFPNGPI